MSNYTFATVIVTNVTKPKAQAAMGDGFFTVPLSASGELPATHWMSSGAFDNVELDNLANVFTWPKRMYFGTDAQVALTAENLQFVQEAISINN